MAHVQLSHVSKKYASDAYAVKDFDLEVPDGAFLVIVGPSGCGKSTTLRMVAGLEDITEGELYIDGQLMNKVEPKNRDIAMVFQNYALYPHMTVYENMAFALKLRKLSKSDIDQKVRQAAAALGLDDLLNRKPKELSGGQRQRVAMGRAIVRNPKVFLMDEPLSNLDAKLRVQMRMEIARLHRDLGATIIYVTHDQIEAMTLGTVIVVMDEGVIQQVATPHDLYHHPANRFVAGFIGSPQMNFLAASCIDSSDTVMLKGPCFEFELDAVRSRALREGGYVGKNVIVGARPEAIVVGENGSFAATVQGVEALGAETHLYCALGSETLAAKLDTEATFDVGSNVTWDFDLARIRLFDEQTGEALRLA